MEPDHDPQTDTADTGDLIDPDADDPTDDEVAPGDPSHVDPFPYATPVEP